MYGGEFGVVHIFENSMIITFGTERVMENGITSMVLIMLRNAWTV